MALVSQWLLDENAANTTVADSVASNTATSERNTSLISTTGPNALANTALDFNGTTDRALIAVPSGIYAASGGFTLTAWINPVSAGELDAGRIMDTSAFDAAGYTFYLGAGAGGKLALRAGVQHATDDLLVLKSLAVTENTWQFVAFVYNEDSGQEGKLYVDSALQTPLDTEDDGVGAIAPNNGAFAIGNIHDATTRAFDGDIADVRFYDTALNATAVEAVRQDGIISETTGGRRDRYSDGYRTNYRSRYN